MMSSDILLLVLHKNYCCTWKYILKLIFKGFFLINRCLIFKVRRTRFVSAWILYHTAPQLSTLFSPFLFAFFNYSGCFAVPGFLVYRNAMGAIVLLFYCFITFSLLFVGLVLVVFVSDLSIVFALSRFNFVLIRCWCAVFHLDTESKESSRRFGIIDVSQKICKFS